MHLTLLSQSSSDFTFYQGIVIAVSGIITVLLVLALISFCIWIVSKIIYAAEHKDEKTILRKAEKKPAAPVIASAPPVSVKAEDAFDEKELVAAITAAIAASLNTTTDALVVRSFRKSANWQKEAIHEQRQHTSVL